jgi:hypothetical protein
MMPPILAGSRSASPTVTVDLSAASGTLTVEWFNPSLNQTNVGSTVTGGSVVSLTAPATGDAVLYLHN